MIDKEKQVESAIVIIVDALDLNSIPVDIGISAVLNVLVDVTHDHKMEKQSLLDCVSGAWDAIVAEKIDLRKIDCVLKSNL